MRYRDFCRVIPNRLVLVLVRDLQWQLLSARLGGRQCRLGALRDRLALVFGNGRQKRRKPVRNAKGRVPSDAAFRSKLRCVAHFEGYERRLGF